MQTELSSLLEIQYPIIQGGMAWVAEYHLAAAVSEAGGLGLIGAANAPADWVREQICEVKKRTDRPFGVNIMLLRAPKVTGEDIIVKEPKTASGDRYVYFSAEMASLLKEYRKFCEQETETYDERKLSADDYIFRRHGMELPMTPSSFTWRFKLILKKHGLPSNLNVHSLRHTAASLMIAGGADVATVSGFTLDIYTHAFDDKKKAASAVLQESLDI